MSDETLSRMEQDARDELATNKGHLKLVSNLTALLQEATDCEFHDFLNDKYPAPKMALDDKLTTIRRNMIEGKYDN